MTPEDLIDLFGCVALEPDVGGILFVNLDPRLLSPYADMLARAIGTVEGKNPGWASVGADTIDEQLWPDWGVMLAAERALSIGPRLGLIRPSSGPLLIAPDLARVGTPVTRAAVTTLGNDVVHVERPGVSEHWPACTRWLAACAGRDLATLSPHLLDRFPVRVDGAAAPRTLDPEQVATADHLGQVRGSNHSRPVLSSDLLDLLLRLDAGQPSIRRCLALARVSRALAERRGAAAVEDADVRRAAALIGVILANEPAPVSAVLQAPAQPGDRPPVSDMVMVEPARPAVDHAEPDVDDHMLSETAAVAETRAPVVAIHIDSLHPEDDPGALPEPRSLQWSVTGRAAARRAAGTIVGHERTSDFRDLAVVPTLLQSLLRTWSEARRSNTPIHRPTIRLQDLRRNRRKHGPHSVLVLVLDHSVRHGWDGSPGMAPHLRWAYDQGAALSVIEFGHADSRDMLRPERYRANSIADPRIVASLQRAPGAASPLAAALELAGEELRRRMHRGWALVRLSRLVIVTDGRGNVPLEATAERRVTTRVARQGVDDALATARSIAALPRVIVTVVAPVDEQYPSLTADLAFALGGSVAYVEATPGRSE